jgi:hypothetical protein
LPVKSADIHHPQLLATVAASARRCVPWSFCFLSELPDENRRELMSQRNG